MTKQDDNCFGLTSHHQVLNTAFLYLRPDDGWYGRNNCRLASSLINFLVNSCVRHYFIYTILLT
jgi:hypothetical protein